MSIMEALESGLLVVVLLLGIFAILAVNATLVFLAVGAFAVIALATRRRR